MRIVRWLCAWLLLAAGCRWVVSLDSLGEPSPSEGPGGAGGAGGAGGTAATAGTAGAGAAAMSDTGVPPNDGSSSDAVIGDASSSDAVSAPTEPIRVLQTTGTPIGIAVD